MSGIVGGRDARRPYLPRAGFTLTELLVVIATISILACLLLPALRRGVEQARLIACLGNQKQVGMAVTLYATANRAWLPKPLSGNMSASYRVLGGDTPAPYTRNMELLVTYIGNIDGLRSIGKYPQDLLTIADAGNITAVRLLLEQ